MNPAFFAAQIAGAAKHAWWLSAGCPRSASSPTRGLARRGLVVSDGAVLWMDPGHEPPSHNAVAAQPMHCTGRQWNAVFNCQGNTVRGPDFLNAIGRIYPIVNQDGQTGTKATDTATIPADQKGHTRHIGGGHGPLRLAC
jgi:hypothetical protein